MILVFSAIHLTSGAFANDTASRQNCQLLFRVQRAIAFNEHPPLPAGVKILQVGQGYVIYSPRGETKRFSSQPLERILFDARLAEISGDNKMFPQTNNHPGHSLTWADVNKVTGRVYIREGQHRAVSASQGYPISQKLGGTTWPYWLDYVFGYRFSSQPEKILTLPDVAVTWDPSVFE